MSFSGPYCPVPQSGDGYIRVVYPVSRGCIAEAGELRSMTQAELDAMSAALHDSLAGSFELAFGTSASPRRTS